MSFRPDFFIAVMVVVTIAVPLHAQTPGYPERVVQWTVEADESCEDIAAALYGSAAHKGLVQRYNSVACTPGAPLKQGLTLVLPAEVTTLPTAKITSVNPETRARPSGGGWATAYSGQPLTKSSSVNTRDKGRAGIQFIDRTRIYLAEHTLVVIYGSAAQTQVSKSQPAAVELKSGELQAGLAALRGRPMSIDVDGGGRVDASSKDSVVHKMGKRTNVAVFDGSAKVTNVGKSVEVPTNHGTRFFEKKAPEPPRPLPPAPVWEPGGSGPLVLGFGGTGVIAAAWKAVPNAKQYRVEVSRDADFTDLVVREQVPANILSFRAESFPKGAYHLRVRAIDNDDFLGIAATPRTMEIVGAQWLRGAGTERPGGLEVGRYAVLALTPATTVQVSFDDGPFGRLPSTIDFRRLAPRQIRVRAGETIQTQPVRYLDPQADLRLSRQGANLVVDVTFTSVDGIDVTKVLAPRAKIDVDGRVVVLPLTKVAGLHYRVSTTVPTDARSITVSVHDDFGSVVATEVQAVGEPDPAPPVAPPVVVHYRLGAMLGAMGMSPRTNMLWTSPTAPNHGMIGARIDGGPTSVQGFAHASGALGPVGLDASVLTPATEHTAADSSAWFGLRYRAFQSADHTFELGPVLRIAFPLDDRGPSPRFEPTMAFGGALDDCTWLVNVGARLRLEGPNDERAFVDAVQGFVLAGGSYSVLSWLRFSSHLDLHLLAPGAAVSVLGRGGLALGAEAGERFFVSVGGRVTPWDDVGGHVSGQLGLGLREF